MDNIKWFIFWRGALTYFFRDNYRHGEFFEAKITEDDYRLLSLVFLNSLNIIIRLRRFLLDKISINER